MLLALSRCLFSCLLLFPILLSAGCGGKESKEGSVADELAKAKKTSDPALRARRLVAVAGKQREAGDVSGSQSSIKLALSSCKDINKTSDRLKALNSVAEALAETGYKTEAEDVLKTVKKEYPDIQEDLAKVQVATKMAEVYGRYLGKPRTAVGFLSEVESSAESITDPAFRVQAMAEIAVAYHQFEAADQSAAQMQKTLSAAKQIEDTRKRTEALIAVASRLIDIDKKSDAKQLLDEADKLTESIEEPHSRAYALVSLAVVLNQAGDKSAAKAALGRADDVADKADSSLRAALKEKISTTKKEI